MKTFYAIAVALLGTTLISAQNYQVHQVIFLNEGWYDYFNDTLMVPPSVASYDPAAGQYHEFATIADARFATDVVVDDAIYVAADRWLIKYDKNTLTELDRAWVPGIRKVAVWQNYVLVSRGEFLQTFDNYVQAFQKSTLTLFNVFDTITGPKYAVEGIAVVNDTAYVAVGNGFDIGNEKGIIGIIDLHAMTYIDEVDMGFDARNPDNVMMDDAYIYTLNNKDYGSSSISRFDPATRSFTVFNNIAANSGCGTSVLANDHVYYMEYAQNELARFSTQSLTIVDTLTNTMAYYGMTDDPINQQLYATVTDYFSSGRAYILAHNGTVKDSFDVGISAGTIALDVRESVGVNDFRPLSLAVSPNPVTDRILVTANTSIGSLRVWNTLGECVRTAQPNTTSWSIGFEDLTAGVYYLEVATTQGARTVRSVVKQ
jgi:hypothetical protein